MNKSILFMHRFGPQMASYRYRVQMPAEELGKLNGFKVGINTTGDYDIVVLSKPARDDVVLAEQAKKEGAKLIVDVSDDHFSDGLSAVFHELAGMADGLVVATDVMRDRVHKYVGKDAFVLGDAYEMPECKPHAEGKDLVWFGHQVNLKALTDSTRLLKGRPLRVVTGPKQIPETIPWSVDNLRDTLALSNIAIFPVSAGSEFKSNNRLINAIRSGCFAVCDRHPSYLEFRPYVWVGDFYTGLRWTDAFQSHLNDCVAAAQDYIRDKYSPETIGKQWASMMEAV